MKKAMKLLSAMLILMMIISSFCINSGAYGIGGYTQKNGNGESLYNIFLWNMNNQSNNNYTLYADLTQYSAASYTFGACFASIYGYSITRGRWEYYDYTDQYDEYKNQHNLWYFAATSFKNNGTFCSDECSVTNFIPNKAMGTAILGLKSSAGLYMFRNYAGENNPENIRFVPVAEHTYTKEWNFG